jgi:sacsin
MMLVYQTLLPTTVLTGVFALCVMQVTPALVRKLLASNASQLAQRLSQQQQQQQQLGAGQPPAAVLLQYCLSDIRSSMGSNSVSTAADAAEPAHGGAITSSSSSNSGHVATELLSALRQLNGLPLLPAADGSLQPIRVGLQSSSSSRNRQSGQTGSTAAEAVLYVPADAQEQHLLSQLPGQLLHPGASTELKQQLLQIAPAGFSNISIISCKSLDEALLPQLLPPAWFGKLEVTWDRGSNPTIVSSQGVTPSTAPEQLQGAQQQQQQQQQQLQEQQRQQQQPSEEFVRLLWQWLAQRSDATDLAHWPVLPVAGGKLRLLQQPAQVSGWDCNS